MTNKLLYGIGVAQVLTLILVAILFFGGDSGQVLSGTTNYDALDVSDGYYVDGTAVIDGSGNLTITQETQLNTLVFGGTELSMASSSSKFTSSTGVYAITAADVCDNNIITVENWAGSPSSTVVLQLTTATLFFADCLDTWGDTKQFLFRNEATNVGSSTLIKAGTGVVLTRATSTKNVAIDGGASAIIQLWRLNETATSSGIQANIIELIDAD